MCPIMCQDESDSRYRYFVKDADTGERLTDMNYSAPESAWHAAILNLASMYDIVCHKLPLVTGAK